MSSVAEASKPQVRKMAREVVAQTAIAIRQQNDISELQGVTNNFVDLEGKILSVSKGIEKSFDEIALIQSEIKQWKEHADRMQPVLNQLDSLLESLGLTKVSRADRLDSKPQG